MNSQLQGAPVCPHTTAGLAIAGERVRANEQGMWRDVLVTMCAWYGNRLGYHKRSQLDSMQLLSFRQTQLPKTGIGNTFDEVNENMPPEDDSDLRELDADLTLREVPAPWRRQSDLSE